MGLSSVMNSLRSMFGGGRTEGQNEKADEVQLPVLQAVSVRDTEMPEKVSAYVLVDKSKGVIYVDRNHQFEPEIRTWVVRRSRDAENPLPTTAVDASELAQHAARVRAESDNGLFDDDDENRFRGRVRDMLYRAGQAGASDVHIQVRPNDTVVHFVVSGESRLAESLTREEGTRALRSIYQGLAQSTSQSYQQSEYQSAQIPGSAFPTEIGLTSIRIMRGPCYPQESDGEFMTLRMQYSGGSRKAAKTEPMPYPPKPEGHYRLAEMGFDEGQLERLDKMMAMPEGLILFVGPTGSGKTTSIFEFLSEGQRRKPYKRVITVEDPVEIPIPTAVQMSVTNAQSKEETARAYQSAVRTMLRMAPKVILIGELRDEEVAALALEAAATGHLVVATLHVDEAFQWVDRLETMGAGKLKRLAFCDPKRVRGVITQRILSHLCPSCSIPISELDEIPRSHRMAMSSLKTWGDISNVRVRGKGCEDCRKSGVKGRYAIAEVIETDEALMRDFVQDSTAIARKNYRARPNAEKSMIERAIEMVLYGKVDPVVVEDNIDVIPPREKFYALPHLVSPSSEVGDQMVDALLEARA